MPEVITRANDHYSGWVGSVFVFNLIVGTGALTLPFAFSKAGWLVSLIVIIILATMSYVTATFVIESMAAANAVMHWKRRQQSQVEYELPRATSLLGSDYDTDRQINREHEDNGLDYNPEKTPLLESDAESTVEEADLFAIQEKIEMGQMMSLFYSRVGTYLFYGCLSIYLFGDLAIYCAAVAKSLRDITCTYVPPAHSCNESVPLEENCWSGVEMSRVNAYRLYVGLFVIFLGPFVFFNVQKTKYLQLFTTLLRWIAFLTMIVLAIIHLAQGKGKGTPSLAKMSGIPSLFGVCVYSFMCHHSLPSLVTPISNKSRLHFLFAFDYLAILMFYILIGMTGVFTFASVYDLYTLNFQPDKCNPNDPDAITNLAFVRYFLALFPVFTLSTNFPIIGITLRNNLQSLFLKENQNFFMRRMLFPLVAILPPTAVAIVTENVGFLVDFTGSYAGAGIQYIIPTVLAFKSRRICEEMFGVGTINKHSSPFRHKWWLGFVLIWAASCVVIVTVNNFIS